MEQEYQQGVSTGVMECFCYANLMQYINWRFVGADNKKLCYLYLKRKTWEKVLPMTAVGVIVGLNVVL